MKQISASRNAVLPWLVVFASIAAPSLPPRHQAAPPPTAPSAQTGQDNDQDAAPAAVPLQGVGVWDVALVQEFFKKQYHIDVAAAPRPYPRQGLLSKLNPEFAKRVDAVMALCQTLGANDLGVASGLRTEAEQIALYKECRKRKRNTDGTLAAGTSAGDWETIPLADRHPKATTKTIKIDVTDPKTGTKSQQTVTEEIPPCPKGDTVTDAWGAHGWHTYGMALDMGYFPGGRYSESKTPFLQGPWMKAAFAAANMGFAPGVYFRDKLGKPAPDYGHLEWHPRFGNDAAQVPGLTVGTAMPEARAQILESYAWKLPARINFLTNYGPGSDPILKVIELSADGNWICMNKMRVLHGDPKADWAGEWYTFDPAIKLFPAYIPCSSLERDEGRVKEDEGKWRAKATVTQESFNQRMQDGKVIQSESSKRKGVMHYFPALYMTDWRKVGDFWRFTGLPMERFQNLRDSHGDFERSIYEIKLQINSIFAGEASKEKIRTISRAYFDNGAGGTTEDSRNTIESWILAPEPVNFVWDRDQGMVFAPMTVVPAYQISASNKSMGVFVSSSTPPGQWDKPKPPKWVTPKPRSGTMQPLTYQDVKDGP